MKASLEVMIRGSLIAVMTLLVTDTALGKTIKWKSNTAGRECDAWNTTCTNWANADGVQVYEEGDHVIFDCCAHYPAANFTVRIDPDGVTPGALLINNPWCCNTITFTNGNVYGNAMLVMTNAWANPNLQVNFDGYTNSLAFSGGTFVKRGTLNYRPGGAGSNDFGSGRITILEGTFCLQPLVDGVTNWNEVTVHNKANWRIRGGSVDVTTFERQPGGNVIFDLLSGTPRDIHLRNGAHISATHACSEIGLAGRYPTKSFYGDLTVSTGGVLRLLPDGEYGRAGQHGAGDLRLLGDSTVDIQFGWYGSTASPNNGNHLTYGYSMQSASQKLYLGDANSGVVETITFRGGGKNVGPGPLTGGFFFGTDSSNIVDSGSTILRYETAAPIGRENKLQFGWSRLAGVKALTCCTMSQANVYPFRGGSAGTIFAPYNTSNAMFSAVGAFSGAVFTVTNSARVVTEGKVAFYNWGNAGNANRCGYLGPVEIKGGSFSLEGTNGIVAASSITVTNNGILRGGGMLQCSDGVVVFDGSVSPGLAEAGTLAIEGSLKLNALSKVNVKLGVPKVLGNGTNDLLVVKGDLTLDGVLELSPANGFLRAGSYTIITYTGTLSDNGLTSPYTVTTDIPGEVQVIIPPTGTVIAVR